jgi:hypothetical protein
MSVDAERTDERTKRHHNWIEIASAILLALATVASAWSAYQATRWHGHEAKDFSDSNTLRIYSAEAQDKANHQLAVDAAIFSDYAYAFHEGNAPLVRFYEDHLFSPEMKAAVIAWQATDPLVNPDAPRTPFEMDEYKSASRVRAVQLDRKAEELIDKGRESINQADTYIMLTVLFALVLFFAGISTKFSTLWVKYSLLVMGGLLFAGSLVVLFMQPFA